MPAPSTTTGTAIFNPPQKRLATEWFSFTTSQAAHFDLRCNERREWEFRVGDSRLLERSSQESRPAISKRGVKCRLLAT